MSDAEGVASELRDPEEDLKNIYEVKGSHKEVKKKRQVCGPKELLEWSSKELH